MKRVTRDNWAWPRGLAIALASVGLCACGAEEAGTPPATTAPIAGAGASVPASTTPSTTTTAGPATTPSRTPTGTGPTATTPPAAPTGPAGMAGSAAAAPSGGPPTGTPTPAGSVSYHKDIRPIIEARCLGCHIQGGSGPFPLDTWAAVDPVKSLVVNAVKTRRMPPWLADSTNCTPTRGDQRLTEAQLGLFTSWEGGQFPVGVETEFKPLAEPPVPTVEGEPNIIIKALQPHRLSAGQEYYSCEATDASFSEDTWVYAMDVVPENPDYVHHAIVNIGGAPGQCDALGLTAENIYSYRPGSRTLVFEKGDALLFRAGTSVSIQFHYNTKFAPSGESVPTDQSPFRLWTLPAGQMPERKIARMPNHDLSLNIAVGAVDQQEGNTQSISAEFVGGEIIGISPHMHYLGQKFHETLHNGGTETCLVDIPDWDQSWQLDYFFNPEDFIKVQSGASVEQVCVYSNRAEDQGKDPNGMPFTPQYTTFGEDTRQEMCLGYIWFRTPVSGGGAR